MAEYFFHRSPTQNKHRTDWSVLVNEIYRAEHKKCQIASSSVNINSHCEKSVVQDVLRGEWLIFWHYLNSWAECTSSKQLKRIARPYEWMQRRLYRSETRELRLASNRWKTIRHDTTSQRKTVSHCQAMARGMESVAVRSNWNKP